MDDEAMFVRTESLPRSAERRPAVRLHTPIGSAVVLWCGDPRDVGGRHRGERTVDEEIRWGRNTHPISSAEPGLRQDGDRVIMSGRLHLAEAGDGAAHLQMGPWPVLFDLASPIPGNLNGSWVEVDLMSEDVSLYPYET
ncbi:hypothetical protein GWI34_30265 [Actinomadura sp. DSM 109109]|nr:hypothetical protein [Actinomadura lepetitiana]